MSGGSYNYLCHTWDLEDIINKRDDLKEMGERLSGLSELEFPGSQAAAQATLRLYNQLLIWDAHASAQIELLRDVWKAVEWVDSMDSADSAIVEALDKLVGKPEKEE